MQAHTFFLVTTHLYSSLVSVMNIAAFLLSVLSGIMSHENGILLALRVLDLTIWQRKKNIIAKRKCFLYKYKPLSLPTAALNFNHIQYDVKWLNLAERSLFEYLSKVKPYHTVS